MQLQNFYAQDVNGNIVPGAVCSLFLPGTTTLATGLIDVSGAPLSNPFSADANGLAQFGAPNGAYDLKIEAGLIVSTLPIVFADTLAALNQLGGFLGNSAAAPITRVDGTPLQIGDRYLKTPEDIEYIYKSTGWEANNLDGQLLAEEGGSTLIGTIIDFISGAPRTVANKIQDTIHVRDFGAVGGGSGWPVSDWYTAGSSSYRGYADLAAVQADYPDVTSGLNTIDSAAFQGAWRYADSAGIGSINCNGSTWVLNKGVTGKPVLWDGLDCGGATLIWDNMAGSDGFVFVEADKVGLTGGVHNLQMVARASNGGTGIKCPKNSSQYSTFFTKWSFKNLYCRGANRNLSAFGFCWDFAFQSWISPGDCAGLNMEFIQIHGNFDISIDPAGQLQGYGIYLDANAAILTARLNKIEIFATYTPVAIGRRAFFSIDSYDLSGYNGIFQVDATNVYNEPKIGKGNINCQNKGVYFTDSSARDLDSITIRRHRSGWKGATNNWYAIHIERCNSLRVTGCVMQPDESDGAFTGTQWGVYLNACGSAVIEGNLPGLNLDYSYDLDNCSGWTVSDSPLAGLSGIALMLRNNSRRGVISGLLASTSAATYTLVSDDGTIDWSTISYVARNQVLESASPFQIMRETDAAVDNKVWRTIVNGGVLQMQQLNDAGSATNYGLITSVAHAITNLEWRAARIYVNGSTVETNTLRPVTTAAYPLGDASHLWTTVYASTGTINTSDERLKINFGKLSDAEIGAAKEMSKLIGLFQWKASVDDKGEDARLHVGLTVQGAMRIMEGHGLDPMRYGFICYDEWDAEPADYYEDGEIRKPAVVAGNRYAFRMDQLSLFLAAGFEARIASLESK